MSAFFNFFIQNYKLSGLMVLVLIFLGVIGVKNLKSESRPPVDFAKVTISTVFPGASPEEIEEMITSKIEDEIRGIEGIKDVSSVSETGQSNVSIRIDMDNFNTNKVADDIQRSVQRVQDLPADILDRPSFLKFNAKEIPIIEMAILGSNENRKRDQLADELESILEEDSGVSSIRLSGYQNREFQVLLDPQKMQKNYIGITEVVEAIKRRSQNIPAGFIRIPENQKLVRVTGQIKSAAEMADIVVRSNFSGKKVLIKDIAEIKDGKEDASIKVQVDGEPATLITVSKKAQADAIKTVENLNVLISRFESKLPQGYRIIEYNNEASRIADRLNIVINNALFGLVFVFVIMLIFLPGVLGAMASLSLPLALMGTLGLMYIWDINFNNITMLAMVIAIGMLVDNSVVISENYARLRMEGLDNKPAALKAVHQFWIPLTATVLTTIVAFLPMLVTKGIMGQFIKWIPIMVSVALSMSLIEGFLLLPARLQFTVNKLQKYKTNSNNQHQLWFDKLKNKFEYFMSSCIHKRYWILFLITVLLVSSVIINIKANRFELFPSEEVEYYFASFESPITSTIEQTDAMAKDLSFKVKKELGEEVNYIVSRVGNMRIGTRGDSKNGDYVGMLTIAIKPDRAKVLDPVKILRKLRSINKGPFTKLVFEVAKGGPPVGQALSVTFRSRNYAELKNIVQTFKEEIKEIPGVVDIDDNEIRGGPEFKITPDYEAISRLKITTEGIGIAMRSALQGAFASELTDNGKDFKLRVRYDDKNRATLNALKNTFIMEPQGRLIPLSSIVKIEEHEGPSVRKHYNFKRSITVTSDVDVEKITSIQLNNKAREIYKELSLKYPTVTVNFGGEEESTKESTSSLKNAMIIAIVSIFAILVFLFHSYLVSLLVLTTIPLGLVGVSWAFFFHQKPLSFLALIGVVGLAGVVVNSAIVLISYTNDVIKDGKLSIHEALSVASSHRLRAVLVTSLTTVGGLFPTAYGWGGHDSILVPMTLALAWGLVSGTLLTLIWVPCGYAIIFDIDAFFKRLFQKSKHVVKEEVVNA
ncbi:MAG: efflux RND transporter permease subunit [Bdellovibrionaceae bacterium]|nr:efflux RND transporter permease subunit [Pseudobdellovibrionaceae bacterium]